MQNLENFGFRATNLFDVPSHGLFGKDINNLREYRTHVGNNSKDQWISCTWSLAVTMQYATKKEENNHIVIINLDSLNVRPEDAMYRKDWKDEIQDERSLKQGRKAYNFGIAQQEFGVPGYIPPESILVLVTEEQLDDVINSVQLPHISATSQVATCLTDEERTSIDKACHEIGLDDTLSETADTFLYAISCSENESQVTSVIENLRKTYLTSPTSLYKTSMTQLAEVLDKACIKYIKEGRYEEASKLYLAIFKSTCIMQNACMERLNLNSKKVLLQYEIPQIEHIPLKELTASHTYDAEKNQKEMYEIVKMLADEQWKTVNNTIQTINIIKCDEQFYSAQGDSLYIEMLQSKFGGLAYENNMKWVGLAQPQEIQQTIKQVDGVKKNLQKWMKEGFERYSYTKVIHEKEKRYAKDMHEKGEPTKAPVREEWFKVPIIPLHDKASGISCAVGEQRYIQLLQEKFGGHVYDNDTKWMSYADKKQVTAFLKDAVQTEQTLWDTAQKMTKHKTSQTIQEYKDALLKYNQAWGKTLITKEKEIDMAI